MANRQTLTPEQLERFLTLRDSLFAYAGRQLEVPGVPVPPARQEARAIDADTLFEISSALWEDRSIIDSYLRDNPDGFGPDDLATIQGWRNSALQDIFFAFDHKRRVYLEMDGFMYAVCGLAAPVRHRFSKLPCPAYACLLPFEGLIVHDGALTALDLDLSAEMKQVFLDAAAHAVETCELVRDAQRFVEAVPLAEEARVARESDEMMRELETEAAIESGAPIDGHHRGALAGLSDEERAAAVEAHWREHDKADRERRILDSIEEACTKGEPRTKLADLLALKTKNQLVNYAELFDIPDAQKLRKADLVKIVAGAVVSNLDVAPEILGVRSPRQVRNIRRLSEGSGTLFVDESQVAEAYVDLPLTLVPFVWTFRKGSTFAIVMPDEVRELAHLIDWDYAEQLANEFGLVPEVASTLVTMRGVVTMDDAYDEYRALSAHPFNVKDFKDTLTAALVLGDYDYNVLYADDCDLLLHVDLAYRHRREMGIADEDPVTESPISNAVASLMEEQRKVEPKPLEMEIVSSEALTRWEDSLPAVRAMRSYLDAHVPDGQDDYYFADDVVSELCMIMHIGVGPAALRSYFDIFENYGFSPDDLHAQHVLDLLMNMANAVPQWPNNGWSANEMTEKLAGRKLFFDDKGKPKKVGRNDPCPCGSGKKYKQCCGKRG